MKKPATFKLTDADGNTYRWAFWRETGLTQIRIGHKRRTISAWMLRDHDGYTRTLSATWIDAVADIRAVAESYGLTCNIS